MSELIDAILCAFLGAFLTVVIINANYTVTNKEVIKACETSLPRSQNCVMVAVPEEAEQ